PDLGDRRDARRLRGGPASGRGAPSARDHGAERGRHRHRLRLRARRDHASSLPARASRHPRQLSPSFPRRPAWPRHGLVRRSPGDLMDIAIPLFEGFTALDAIGPYEVLSRLPGYRVRFVAVTAGPRSEERRVGKEGGARWATEVSERTSARHSTEGPRRTTASHR